MNESFLVLVTLRMLGVIKEDPKSLTFFGILRENQSWLRVKVLMCTKLSSIPENTICYLEYLVGNILGENANNFLA